MGIFDLDTDRIVRIFHNNGIRMSLKKAFEVANIIYEAHLNRLNEVENNIWDVARQEANKRVEAAYKDGYGQGKMDAEVPSTYEMDKLQRVYDNSIRIANEHIPGIVNRVGRTRKIQCIKELRNLTGLGLKDSKDIVDDYMRKLDAASTNTYYGDEPPF